MITINDISEIEKYKVKDKTIFCGEVDGDMYVDKIYCYKFTENGKLADVTFNCYIPFTTYDIGNADFEIGEYKLDWASYTFIARDVYIKNRFGGGIQNLVARNIYFNGHLEIDKVRVRGTIKGHNLVSHNIKAKNIDCDSVFVFSNDIKCKDIKTKKLNFMDFEFKNVNAPMKDVRRIMIY